MKNNKEKSRRNLAKETKVKNAKNTTMFRVLKTIFEIYALVVVACTGIFTCGTLVENKDRIQNAIAAKNLAMTYHEVGANDNGTVSDYVKFDAYFLQNSKKIRGAAIELNKMQELYLELNILTNGHLENGKIVLNSGNYNIARQIVADNEIASTSGTTINLKQLTNGTQKTIPVLLEQNVVTATIGYKNRLSNVNSVTFTGTHVAEDGTRTQIEKTVDFTLDWYGSKNLESIVAKKTTYMANQNTGNVVIGIQASMYSHIYNATNKQVPDKAAILTSTLPIFNGYVPTSVKVTESSTIPRNLTYEYNNSTRQLKIIDETIYNEQESAELAYYGNEYVMNISITYPYEAYSTLGASTKSLSITVNGYLEGYNNPNGDFVNPAVSNSGNRTVNINLRNPDGNVVIFDTDIDLLTKSKLRLKYDRGIETDNGYRVKWIANIGYPDMIDKLIFEEDNSNAQVGNYTDYMQSTDGSYNSLNGLVSYVGIKVPSSSFSILGNNGYVKVINSTTGETIKTITKTDQDKYITYDEPLEHIKIETNKPQIAGKLEIYNYKKINNDSFVSRYTKDQFNHMTLVHTALNGSIETASANQFINKDIATVEYEDGNTLYSTDERMQLNIQATNKKTTYISLNAMGYDSDKDLTEWVNPVIIMEYPAEVETIDIKDITNYEKELTVKQVTQQTINGKKIVKIELEGATQNGSVVQVAQSIRMNSTTKATTGELRIFAYNELCDSWRWLYNNTQDAADIYDINQNGNTSEQRRVNITKLIYSKPTGLYTNTEGLNFDSKGSIVTGPDVATVEKKNSGTEATVRLNVYNNYNTPVTNAKIVGKIPFEGNTYQINTGKMGSNFTTTMKNTGISLPSSIASKATVYYSTKETVNENISDPANEWTSTPSDWSKVKTYLIDLSSITINAGASYTMNYTIKFPQNLTYGTVSYATHAIYFTENTADGSVARSTEPNKVGFRVETAEKYNLKLTKLQTGTNKTIASVNYKITGPGIAETGRTYSTNSNGEITINSLYPDETYTLEETYAPSGYIKNETPIQIHTYLENDVLKASILQGNTKEEPVVENEASSQPTVKIQVENQAKYNFSLIKYREGTTKVIPNVRFTLQGKGISTTLSTNSSGKINVTGLYPGEEYTIQEISAPSDYIVNNEPIKFKVNENGAVLLPQVIAGAFKEEAVVNNETRTVEVSLENTIKYTVEINKLKTGTTQAILGAQFSIKENGQENVQEVVTTNSSGKATFRNLIPGKTYAIQEMVVPNNYILNQTPIIFTVNKTNGNLEYTLQSGTIKSHTVEQATEEKVANVKLEIENEPKYELAITKYKQNTEEKVEGVTFNLKGEGLPSEGKNFVTDKNGNLKVTGLLPEHEYTMVETSTNSNYVLNNQIIKFKTHRAEDGLLQLQMLEGSVKEQNIVQAVNGTMPQVQISLENEPKYHLQINKYKIATTEKVQGITFNLKGEGLPSEGKNYTTDNNGNISVNNLVYGKEYTLQEVETNSNYILNNQTIQWKATREGVQTNVEHIAGEVKQLTVTQETAGKLATVNLEIENEPKYELAITKYKRDTVETIQGVTFNLKGEGLPEEGKNYTTDNSGNIKVVGLIPEKEYTLQEIKTNTDYMLDTQIIKFKTHRAEDKELQVEVLEGTVKEQNVVQAINGTVPQVQLSIENEPKYNIEITKYETGTNKTIANVNFVVKGKGMPEEGITYTTNSNGIATISKLEQGEVYTIKETYAKGYYINEEEFTVKVTRVEGVLSVEYNGRAAKQTPTIKLEANELPDVEIELENVSIPKYTLELTKVGEKTGKLLEGAEFEVIGAGRDIDVERQYVTAQNGKLSIENLYENEEYTLTEKVAPIGYKLKETPIKLKAIRENNTWKLQLLEGSLLGEPEIENETIKVKWEDELLFKLEKIDEETKEPLIGAKFTIKDLDGNNAKDVDGNEVGTIENINGADMRVVTTDEEGMLTAEIAAGLYEVTEVQAPFGYTLPENPTQYFGIDASTRAKKTADNVTQAITNGGSIESRITSLAPTSDGGYVAVGNSSIIKFSSSKVNEWAKTLGNATFNAVTQTKDGGYIVGGSFTGTVTAGSTTLTSYASDDALLVKYSSNGDVQWIKQIGGDSSDTITAVAETSDRGLLVAGHFSSTSVQIGATTFNNKGAVSHTDGMLVRYTAAGEVEWAKQIGASDYEYIDSIVATKDGGCLLGGYFNSSSLSIGSTTLTNNGGYDGMVIKCNVQGNPEWAKQIGGANSDVVRSVTQTADGNYLAGGYFRSSNMQVGETTLNTNGNEDGMIVKYNGNGDVIWAISLGGQSYESINSVVETKDGGILASGYFASSSLQVEDSIITNQGEYDAMIVKYTNKGETEWAKSVGGTANEEFRSAIQIQSGELVAGGYFYSDNIQIGDSNVDKPGTGSNGIAVVYEEIITRPAVPETQEINFEDAKKEYKITTEVNGVGGTISGQNENPYEAVKYKGNSVKDIIVTPEEGYAVSGITVNGEEIIFTRNEDGTVNLDKFINMTEDKHVVVTFTANPAQVIVHHYVDGTTTKVAEDETIYGETDKPYSTNAKQNLEKYILVESKIPANKAGTMTAETIHVIYYYAQKDAKVIVHHYKDGTNESLAPDEEIAGKVGDTYQTQSKEIQDYELVETKLPENSTGNMTEETIEVIYYYAPIPKGNVIVHHYVEYTEEKVAEDETIEGKVGEDYTTEPKIDLDKYELVEEKLPSNKEGTISKDPIEVIYYYKLKDTKVIVHHYKDGTTQSLAPDEEIIGKIDDNYQTYAKTDLSNYEVVEEKLPENAAGTMTKEVIEVTYYYNIKDSKVIVHHYVEYTEEKVADDEEIAGKVGENYTTEPKIDLDKYELVEEKVPSNKEGTITKDPIEVIYYYKLKDAKVIVEYREEGTEKILAQEEMVEGKVDQYYNVEYLEKQINGYNRTQEVPENKEGTMLPEDIIVIYYYHKKPADIIQTNITKDGTKWLELGKTADYQIVYTAEIAEYIGDAKITITDKLPYAINLAKSNLNGGNYDEVNNTITWTEDISNIDTYENGNKQIRIEKEVELFFMNIDYKKDSFVNKAVGKIELASTNQEEQTPEVEIETKYEIPEIDLTTNITKTGDEKITKTEANIYYEIEYQGTINNFAGKAKITIVDNLPYAINEEKSNLSGGKYNEEERTITWEETIENIDTFATNESKNVSISKTVSLSYIYENEETLNGSLVNRVTSTTDLQKPDPENPEGPEQTVLTDEKSDDHEVKVELPATVVVHHYIYDKQKEEYTTIQIANDEVKNGLVGEKYTTTKSPEVPSNYTVLMETPENYKGAMTKTPIEVIYYYQLIDETITNEVEKTAKADKTLDNVTINKVETDDAAKTKQTIEDSTFTKEPNMQEAFNALTGSMKASVEAFMKVNEAKSNEVATVEDEQTKEKEDITQNKEPQTTVEVLTTEGGKVDYKIVYKVNIKDYLGKAKVKIVDTLPAAINVEKSNLNGGTYNADEKTITWEEPIENIDTFANGTFETTITKNVSLVYEGQNMAADLLNKVNGSITTYYPDNYVEDPENPNKEKETKEAKDEETVKQEYKVDKTVEKVWDDNENVKGNRPASVKVGLTANKQETLNGVALESVVLSEENSWTHTFANLSKYDSLGKEIAYSVEESEVTVGDLEYYEAPQIVSSSTTNKIVVTNSYKLVNTTLDSTIIKDGTEKITKTKQPVNYHINYSATITDYIGEATVTMIDYLPYEIDMTKSNIAGGIYDETTKTITWTKDIGHINTTKNEENTYPVHIQKDIKVVFKNIDIVEGTMTNNIKGKIEFTQNDTKNEVTDTHETLVEIRGNVIVKYVDKDTGEEITYEIKPGQEGNENGDKPITKTYGYEIEDKVQTPYETEQKEIYGYTYVENTGNTTGNIVEGTIEVIYYYTKTKAADVTVKYVDEDGNEIAKEEIIKGNIGDPYETEKKEIENYEFVEVTGDSPEGTMTENPKEVIYHYRKIDATVIVRHLEKETEKELAISETIKGKAGDNYQTERKVIEGYKKADPEPTNAVGKMKVDKATNNTIYVTYYYERIPSGKVTVKYVDIDTKQEIIYTDEKGNNKTYGYDLSGYVGEKYKTEEKQIPYYKYVKEAEPTNKEGTYTQNDETVIYYYKKLPFNFSVDKIIKEATQDGKLAKVNKEGKIIKMEIVASKLKQTTIQVKYAIIVKNEGEIEGTATVKDLIPAGFKLANSNPSYWEVQKDGSIVTKVDLKVGETKELEVVLDWKASTNNLGIMKNIAQIIDTKNPANYDETTTEDNNSDAEVVLSIKTGAEAKVLATALGTIAITGSLIVAYQYQRQRKTK